MIIQQKAKIIFSIGFFCALLFLLTNALDMEFGRSLGDRAFYLCLCLGYPPLLAIIAVLLCLWSTDQLSPDRQKACFAAVPQTKRQKRGTLAWAGALLLLFSVMIMLPRIQPDGPIAGKLIFNYWALFCAAAWPVIWRLDDASRRAKLLIWIQAVLAGMAISIAGALLLALALKSLLETSVNLFMPIAVGSMLLPLVAACAAFIVSDRGCKAAGVYSKPVV